jgi:predicted CxxxxCH...CXXCH cytochrome family protein
MMETINSGLKSKTLKLLISLIFIALPLVITISVKDSNAGAGIMGGVHDLTSGGLGNQDFKGGVCNQCHLPHMSGDIRLWRRASAVGTPFVDNDPMRLCLDCHGYDDGQMAAQLPFLTGVIWADPPTGVTPPQITDKAGVVSKLPNHESGRTYCTGCHVHEEDLKAVCDNCHGYPPGYNDPGQTDEKVGSVEFPDVIDADEAGAHKRHATDEYGMNNAPYLGYPKIGRDDETCYNSGCHVTIDEHNVEPHDSTAEIAFDILNDVISNPSYPNHELGDPIIIKDPITGNSTVLGDGNLDLKENGIEQTGRTAAPSTTPVSCENVYCHSTVVKDISDVNLDFWNTRGDTDDPLWKLATGTLKCGMCHDDCTTAPDTEHTGVIMGTAVIDGGATDEGSHGKHASSDYHYDYDCQSCHYEKGIYYLGGDPGSPIRTVYHVDGKVDINIYISNYVYTGFDVTGTYTTAYATAESTTDINLPGLPYPTGGGGRSGDCSNVYCHSRADEAKFDEPGNGDPRILTYTQPTWGDNGTVTCTSCHGVAGTSIQGEPDYSNGGPNKAAEPAGTTYANSHEKHVQTIECDFCHETSVLDSSSPAEIDYTNASHTHVDGKVDLVSPTYTDFSNESFPAAPYDFTVAVSGTPSNEQNVKRCYNSCHNTPTTQFDPTGIYDPGTPDNWANAPQWGGAFSGELTGCYSCHGASVGSPESTVRPIQPPDKPDTDARNKINKTQFESRGHGRSTGTNYVNSGNPGAGFDNADGDGASPGCISTKDPATDPNNAQPTEGCHFRDAAHYAGGKSATDPYRLGNTYASDVDGLCVYCHEPTIGSAIYTEVETSHTRHDTSTRSDLDPTLSFPTWPFEPKCVDCHDPHGDSSDYMIKERISYINGTTTYGSPSLGADAPNLGETQPDIDKTDPVSFSLALGQAGDYYNMDADGEDGICQICHTQNMVYNRRDYEAGEVKVHANNPAFLPEDGRMCTECHLHEDAETASAIRGFARPYIDVPTPAGCADCHTWNPDGQSSGHPMMVNENLGGLFEDHTDPTGENDDISNYVFSSYDSDRENNPSMANYTDRSMLDWGQWITDGHGTEGPLPPTNEWGSKQGPGLPCLDCHEESVPHGQTQNDPPNNYPNPYRLIGSSPYDPTAPDNVCMKTAGQSSGTDCHGAAPLEEQPQHHDSTGAYPEGVCFDCHDPHGDTASPTASLTNISDANVQSAMIQREPIFEDRWVIGADYGKVVSEITNPGSGNSYPVVQYVATGSAADYVENSLSQSGICEVCHDDIAVKYFMRNNMDGETILPEYHEDVNMNCDTCHTHGSPGGSGQGFAVPDWCQCYNCHTGVETQFTALEKHDINYAPVNNPKGSDNLYEDCENVDCFICHDLDKPSEVPEFMPDRNHIDGRVYLYGVGGGPVLDYSTSVYQEEADNLEIPMYGNIKTDDPVGAWCGNCHDGQSGSTYQWTGNSEDPPNVFVSTNFVDTGHGATGVTNFRYAPNPPAADGRSSCTACHNYHGSDNKAMIMRATWNGSSWDEPYPYPIDDDYVLPGQGVPKADSKEVFCFNACHLNTSDPEFGSDVSTYRPNDERAHYLYNWDSNIGGADEIERYNNRGNDQFYFASKAVGFVMGGDDVTSKYVADTNIGEQVTFNESAADINLDLPTGAINPSDESRSLCVTCHDPHGVNANNTTWGHGAPAEDDNMLRDRKTDGVTTFTGAYEQCETCHK